MAATSYSIDSTLYLYTSLTAGSSHIITATSRLETILKANKIPFRAVDCATDEKARMTWGRRSRGRKLPGLVKFGNVIGDLEQIEEWNEYGELKEQLNDVEDFSSIPATSNLSVDPTTSSAQRSDPPSRASSESRHISISDPKDEKKEATPTSDPNPASTLNKSPESPLTMAMRHAGAEAAAKAGLKKTSTAPISMSSTSAAKAAAAPVSEPDPTEKTPTPATIKLSASAEEPSTSTEITAAKTPAQLAFEGAKRTSVDKIDSTSSSSPESTSTTSPITATPPTAASTEQQTLEARRSSSITKTKSRLSEATPAAESETVLQDVGAEEETGGKTSNQKEHRGSLVSDASPEEVRKIEEKTKIPEEDDEDEEAEAEENPTHDAGAGAGISTTDKAEKEATKGTKPQEGEATDADAAGVSVGD